MSDLKSVECKCSDCKCSPSSVLGKRCPESDSESEVESDGLYHSVTGEFVKIDPKDDSFTSNDLLEQMLDIEKIESNLEALVRTDQVAVLVDGDVLGQASSIAKALEICRSRQDILDSDECVLFIPKRLIVAPRDYDLRPLKRIRYTK